MNETDLIYVEPFVKLAKKPLFHYNFAISYKIFHIGLNLMFLLTSTKMLALTEWPNQVNDLYMQINVIILNVKKMVISYFCFPLHARSY